MWRVSDVYTVPGTSAPSDVCFCPNHLHNHPQVYHHVYDDHDVHHVNHDHHDHHGLHTQRQAHRPPLVFILPRLAPQIPDPTPEPILGTWRTFNQNIGYKILVFYHHLLFIAFKVPNKVLLKHGVSLVGTWSAHIVRMLIVLVGDTTGHGPRGQIYTGPHPTPWEQKR